jgi:hypothetical protein
MKKSILANLKMDAVSASRILLRCVASGAVTFTHHAKTRMKSRSLTDVSVLNCLRFGRIVEGPATDTSGMWRFTVARDAGAVAMSVVASIHWDEARQDHIVVVTAF